MSAMGEVLTNGAAGSGRRVPRLPACRSCHQRKVKCDNNRPKCAPCTRNGAPCILIFPGHEQEVSREDLYELEQREQALVHAAQAAEETAPENGWHDSPASSTLAGSLATPDKPGGGSFMTLLFKDAEWRKSHAQLLQTLGRSARAAEAAEAQVEANAMPSAEDVRYLFGKYLSGSHLQNPFLLRHEVTHLYARVFSGDGTRQPAEPTDRAGMRDLFRTYMILAISTIVPYRLGHHPHHPLGYYLSAMQYFGSDYLATELDSVQDLLLICRFGVYYHIGISIWDTIQLCGRLCIELGLHRPRDTPTSLLQEQIERRVFWEYFMLDRYSSTTISRPFAIADRDITVPFPADADDEDLLASGCSDLDSFCRTRTSPPQGPTEMSVFLLCIRLRQISSRIQTEFSQLVLGGPGAGTHSSATVAPFLLTGRIYALLDDILRVMDVWRRGAPVYAHPHSLYEMAEWYDLLLARERLHAVRKAMDLAPKHDGSGSGLPARHLLALCLDAATKTIRLYAGLFRSHMVTYTRSYFHTVFTAGLSVMFCCCASSPAVLGEKSCGRDRPDLDPERERIRESRAVLVLCEETLAHMGAQLPDARGYVTAFEALHKSVSLKLDQALQDEGDGSGGGGGGTASPPNTPEPSAMAALAMDQHAATANNNSTASLDLSSLAVQQVSATAAALSGALDGGLSLGPSNMPFYGPVTAPLPQPFGTDVLAPSSGFGAHTHAAHAVHGGHAGLAPYSTAPVRNELLPWAFLSDDTMWNVVGEYVYGDPNETMGLFSGFDFGP